MIDNEDLIRKVIGKKWNLQQFLTEAAQVEDIKSQTNEIEIHGERNFANVKKDRNNFNQRPN